MALSLRQLRQRIGQELGGIILAGTATSVDGAGQNDITDTSDDSPMDPSDQAVRLSGAGLLLRNPSGANTLVYRQNITYTSLTQNLAFGVVSGLTGTPEYEIHREPLLHPLLIFPRLVNDALLKIRRLAFPHILLNHRGFYDLSRFPDITGSERVRRLYYVGPNLLNNADFNVWNTGADGPDQWTASAPLGRIHVPNYPHAAELEAGETLSQLITGGLSPRRLRAVVHCRPSNGATATLRVTARLGDASTEREVTATAVGTATSTDFELVAEVESTARTADVRVRLESAAQATVFWSPMAYNLSFGRRHRVQPVNVYNEDGSLRMYVARGEQESGIGQFALLLPYAPFSGAATVAADDTTTPAPDELIVAGVCVEVLRWLIDNPDLPSTSKAEYGRALQTWATKFRQRAREHMRRLAKTQQIWEAGELN